MIGALEVLGTSQADGLFNSQYRKEDKGDGGEE